MLKTEDYRRLLAVLSEAERAASLSGWRRTTLETLSTELGWAHAVLITGSRDARKLEGAALGVAQRRLDGLLARVSHEGALDRLLSGAGLPADRALSREDVWSVLGDDARSIADDLLAAEGLRSLLAARLDAPGATKGLLVVLGHDRAPTAHDRERLDALAPHLANLLALHAPRDSGLRGVALLTPREAETVDLVAAGLGNRAIARRLDVTESTVKKHVSAALAKLDVDSRTQLALAWLAHAGSNGAKPARDKATSRA